MGKVSKRLNKKKSQQQKKAESQHVQELREQLTRRIDEMDYDAALETLASLIENKCYDPHVIYQGAQLYFLMGDYERAAAWVNNTLHYAPNHIKARLLLARLCLLEDRTDEAMSLYEFVLKNYGDSMQVADKEDIKDAADYIWRTESEWLKENYSLVASLWKDKSIQQVKQSISKTHTMLIEPVNVEQNERTVTAGDKADDDVRKIITDVMRKKIALREKVRILNSFAGGMFFEQDFSGAILLLEEALKLDMRDEVTLRNIAVAEKERGNRQKAMEYAAQLPYMDFVLLKALR